MSQGILEICYIKLFMLDSQVIVILGLLFKALRINLWGQSVSHKITVSAHNLESVSPILMTLSRYDHNACFI